MRLNGLRGPRHILVDAVEEYLITVDYIVALVFNDVHTIAQCFETCVDLAISVDILHGEHDMFRSRIFQWRCLSGSHQRDLEIANGLRGRVLVTLIWSRWTVGRESRMWPAVLRPGIPDVVASPQASKKSFSDHESPASAHVLKSLLQCLLLILLTPGFLVTVRQ